MSCPFPLVKNTSTAWLTLAGSLDSGDVSIQGGGVKFGVDFGAIVFNSVRRNGHTCGILLRKADKAQVRHLTDPVGAVGD